MIIQPEVTVVWKNAKNSNANSALPSRSEVLGEALHALTSRIQSYFGKEPVEFVDITRINYFATQLQFILEDAGFIPVQMETNCILKSDTKKRHITVLDIHIVIPDITVERFNMLLNQTGELCGISTWTNTRIEVRGTFKSSKKQNRLPQFSL